MISAVIITHNEAANIARCLQSLQGLVQDIVVVDSHSTDDTLAICRQYGAQVHQTTWQGFAKTKNFANSLVHTDWVLSIDADEVLSESLQSTLRSLKPQRGVLYSLDRITNFCGQWIKYSGWYPDWKPRLFHKADCYWVGNYVHEKLKCPSGTKVQKLKGKLYHYSYYSHEQHLQRLHKYAELTAAQWLQQDKSPTISKIMLSAIARFFRTYVLHLGFLDGKNGWIIAKRDAYMIWLRYRAWQRMKRGQV